MSLAGLTLFGVYLGVGFVLRSWLQWRRTGDTGFRGISRQPGAERLAGAAFAVALVTGVLGPIAALAGLDALRWLEAATVNWTGLALATTGIAATLAFQLQMGTSWRIGVDADERTELVTTGIFSQVRNPIFTAMALTGAGLALMTPNPVALAGFATLLVALQLQVRIVEEPYLCVTHGAEYARYSARTGRFLPGLGLMPAPTPAR